MGTRHRDLAISVLVAVVAASALIVALVTIASAQTAPANSVYWTDNNFSRIQRASLDGTGVENLISGLQFLRGIDLDVNAGKMYFVWVDGGIGGTTKISRTNLDGTGLEDLITAGLDGPGFLALDPGGAKMYWTDDVSNSIRRANLDGTGAEDLVTGLTTPLGIALDEAGGKMYWADAGTNKIQRANLDGTSVEDLVTTGLDFPAGIALDIAAGKMYWTDALLASVHRADIDGSNAEGIVTVAQGFPYGIDVDASIGKVYWTNRGDSTISGANLDGSAAEDIVTTGLGDPFGIALEIAEVAVPILLPVDDLQAVAVDRDHINVVWTDRSVGEDGVELERSVEGGAFLPLAVLPPDSEFFSDFGLASDTTYAYRERAFRGGSFADWSNIGIATTPPDILPPPLTLPWIVVNSAGDIDLRDGVITLREGMLIATGLLAIGNLDVGECGQLLNGSFNGVCTSDREFGAFWSDTLVFDPAVFPVANPKTITLASALPELEFDGDGISAALGAFHAGVVVDGVTQTFDCFVINDSDSLIQGLEIKGCDNGILIQNAGLAGTFIDNNLIGGTLAGQGNVISGNVTGIRLDGRVFGTEIFGNYIGTNAEGTAAMANGIGVFIDRSGNTKIGGSDPGAGNLISGNSGSGVIIEGGVGNVLANNLIGTDKTGLSPLPNGGHGVGIGSSTDFNTIGTPETPNTMAYNDGDGVSIGNSSDGNSIRGNSIHSNGGLGINIPFLIGPGIDGAFTDGAGTLLVEGALSGPVDSSIIVDLYSNQIGTQGENYLGSVTVIIDSDGRGVFAHLVLAVVAEGEIITATKTGTEGSTSKFSLGDSAVAAPVVPPDELNIRCTHSPIWPGPGDTISITAEALDGSLESVKLVDKLEIWVNAVLSDSSSGPSTLQQTIGPFPQGTFSYGCRVQDGAGTVFSGHRTVTVGDPALNFDVPVLYNGSPTTKIDMVFIADGDSYGGPVNSQFLADVEAVIRDAFFARPIFLKNQSMFNFWIAGDPGVAGLYDGGRSEGSAAVGTCGDGMDNDGDGLTDADDPDCTKCELEAPAGWDTDLAFADAGAILHTDVFRDCANPNSHLFSTEPFSLGTVIHELGHSPFGLADEYCCDGGYFENSPFPDLYGAMANCEADALDVGRISSDCRQLSRSAATVDWWTSDPSFNDLMVDRGDPQALDIRRIDWLFGRCDQGDC